MMNLIPDSTSVPKRIVVNRSSLLADSIAFFKQRNFDFSMPMKVSQSPPHCVWHSYSKKCIMSFIMQTLYFIQILFIQVAFEGEPAVDGGGPK